MALGVAHTNELSQIQVAAAIIMPIPFCDAARLPPTRPRRCTTSHALPHTHSLTHTPSYTLPHTHYLTHTPSHALPHTHFLTRTPSHTGAALPPGLARSTSQIQRREVP